MTRTLQGQNILLVEDEILIALDLGTALREAGAEVLTVYSAAAALGRIESLSLPRWAQYLPKRFAAG